jgi:multisubunit Na+/H+ antiporter MnhB subunit
MEGMNDRNGDMLRLLALGAMLAFLVISVFSLRGFGEPSNTAMDDYFIHNGQVDTGSNNIVTSVVFDYRDLDTFGETTILFAAVCGIFVVFLGRK